MEGWCSADSSDQFPRFDCFSFAHLINFIYLFIFFGALVDWKQNDRKLFSTASLRTTKRGILRGADRKNYSETRFKKHFSSLTFGAMNQSESSPRYVRRKPCR